MHAMEPDSINEAGIDCVCDRSPEFYLRWWLWWHFLHYMSICTLWTQILSMTLAATVCVIIGDLPAVLLPLRMLWTWRLPLVCLCLRVSMYDMNLQSAVGGACVCE